MPQTFEDFLNTETGQKFALWAEQDYTSFGEQSPTLLDGLVDLGEDLNMLSVETKEPTYDPVVEGLLAYAAKGAQIMKAFGVATRQVGETVPESKEHDYIRENATLSDVFNALAEERRYHDMMFDAGRETILRKSPSELAFTVLGLTNEALMGAALGNPDLGLKKLKDAVATSLRAVQESEQTGSIAAQARRHYQSKQGPGTP